ncbi:MAG: hypothetical protein ABIQ84_06975 [Usitatibacter sp.]
MITIDLRRHHPDLMKLTGHSRDKALVDRGLFFRGACTPPFGELIDYLLNGRMPAGVAA